MLSTAKMYTKMFRGYPDALTVKDLRQMLGIGRNLAYELINKNAIHHVKMFRRLSENALY